MLSFSIVFPERQYEPRQWVTSNYGDQVSGARLLKFIEEAGLFANLDTTVGFEWSSSIGPL